MNHFILIIYNVKQGQIDARE